MNPVRVRAAVGTAGRRVVHVLLGAVVLLPYVAFGWLFTLAVSTGMNPAALLPLLALTAVVGVAVAVVPGARALEVAAAGLAPRLLGPTPSERLAAELTAERRRAAGLAERARIARELHDSVGHALTVTTLQAGAAAELLDSDPAFARRAPAAIEETGRTALEDLDLVPGVLREDGTSEVPHGLDALDTLVSGARSAGVEVEVHRSSATTRGGRGLRGMAERAALLGGELTAGPDDGVWRLAARLPGGGPGVEPGEAR